jgi:hypothetical protein
LNHRPSIEIAIEGLLDEAIAERVVDYAGLSAGRMFGRRGKEYLRGQIGGYNNAARHVPWLVLTDLDTEPCEVNLVRAWLPAPSEKMRLRVAVREIEAWLLADAERIASLLGISVGRVPRNPDTVGDPKAGLVQLARSGRRSVREALVPTPLGGRSEGPGYTGVLTQFVRNANSGWRPEVAEQHSPSLARCIRRLRELV